MMYLSPIIGRNNMGTAFSRAFPGPRTGVEIGTHRGAFANELLSTWPELHLTCVDPYLSNWDERDPMCGRSRGEDKSICLQTLRQHPIQRWQLIERTSEQVCKVTEDASVDFAYVDGDHRRQAVLDDLMSWWPKVRPGGVLSGHDFLPFKADCNQHVLGVQAAVMDFLFLQSRESKRQLDLFMVSERNLDCWSWYVEKPK